MVRNKNREDHRFTWNLWLNDDDSGKHPLKYFCLKFHIWWEINNLIPRLEFIAQWVFYLFLFRHRCNAKFVIGFSLILSWPRWPIDFQFCNVTWIYSSCGAKDSLKSKLYYCRPYTSQETNGEKTNKVSVLDVGGKLQEIYSQGKPTQSSVRVYKCTLKFSSAVFWINTCKDSCV